MKKIIVTSLLLVTSLCTAADDRFIEEFFVNTEAWDHVSRFIGYYGSITKAHYSEELNLDKYELKTSPNLNYLRHLVKLSLNDNQLTDIPDSRNLPLLRELNLDGNHIATIPNELQSQSPWNEHGVGRAYIIPGICIRVSTVPEDLRFGLLKTLSLDDNQIEALPNDLLLRELKTLSLKNNQIRAIDSGALDRLPNLRKLYLEGNLLCDENMDELRKYAESRENLTIVFGEQKKGLNTKGAKK